MEYFLIAFRSRSQAFEFSSLMVSYGASSSIINTPRQIGVSCSISIKTNENGFLISQTILSRRKFASFNGYYKIKQTGMIFDVIPIFI